MQERPSTLVPNEYGQTVSLSLVLLFRCELSKFYFPVSSHPLTLPHHDKTKTQTQFRTQNLNSQAEPSKPLSNMEKPTSSDNSSQPNKTNQPTLIFSPLTEPASHRTSLQTNGYRNRTTGTSPNIAIFFVMRHEQIVVVKATLGAGSISVAKRVELENFLRDCKQKIKHYEHALGQILEGIERI